jgi:hypothetical protein
MEESTVDPVSASRAPARRLALLRALYWGTGAAFGVVSVHLGQSRNLAVFSTAAYDFAARRGLYPGVFPFFKYSPAFALAFLPFLLLPLLLRAALWSALNFGVALEGILAVVDRPRAQVVAALVAFAGIVLTSDGDQSNLLIAGALLLGMRAFERGRDGRGALFVVGAAFIKVFPLAGAAFALFSPSRPRALAWITATGVALAAAPAVWIGPRALLGEYVAWRKMMLDDYETAHSFARVPWSFGQMLHDGLGVTVAPAIVHGVLLAATFAPLAFVARVRRDTALHRTFACSLLVALVLFNHRAEYCTYAIAAVAVAVWLAASSRPRAYQLVVAALVALAFAALGPYYTTPPTTPFAGVAWLVASRTFHPLRLVPLAVLWVLMQRELWAASGPAPAPTPVSPPAPSVPS